MLTETIRTRGLNHLSRIPGGNDRPAVIDPRCTLKLYVAIKNRCGAQITYIFETPRTKDREDFLLLGVGGRAKAHRHKQR